MCYFRVFFISVALHVLALSSCSGLEEDNTPSGPINGAESTAGVVAGSGSGGNVAVLDSGIETAQSGAPSAGGMGGTTTNADASRGDSSFKEAGVPPVRESGVAGTPGTQTDSAVLKADASVITEGGVQPPLTAASCCEVHPEPGCNNVQTQACVCEKLPDCCTTSWDLPCTLIVIQKFCEPGVRECVCGPAAEGGWEQTECCEIDWTNFCEDTAIIKCGAKSGC